MWYCYSAKGTSAFDILLNKVHQAKADPRGISSAAGRKVIVVTSKIHKMIELQQRRARHSPQPWAASPLARVFLHRSRAKYD
jgi:hypothetical protein